MAVAATAPLGIHASQTGPAAPHPTDAAAGGPKSLWTDLLRGVVDLRHHAERRLQVAGLVDQALLVERRGRTGVAARVLRVRDVVLQVEVDRPGQPWLGGEHAQVVRG